MGRLLLLMMNQVDCEVEKLGWWDLEMVRKVEQKLLHRRFDQKYLVAQEKFDEIRDANNEKSLGVRLK